VTASRERDTGCHPQATEHRSLQHPERRLRRDASSREHVEVDVTKDGCGELVPSEAACPVEYDLAAIVDDVVYFGDRTNPLCSKETRPTKLAEWGVVKQP
jgi:hypothetical protein